MVSRVRISKPLRDWVEAIIEGEPEYATIEEFVRHAVREKINRINEYRTRHSLPQIGGAHNPQYYPRPALPPEDTVEEDA